MVDVTHDGHHRRPRFERHILVLGGFLEEGIRIVQFGGKRLVAHFLDDDHGRFLVQHLVDGDHRTHFHHDLDDFDRLDRHLVRQIGYRNGFGNMNLADDDFGRRLEAALAVVDGMPVLLVSATSALPRTARVGRAGLDARLLPAVVRTSVAALLGLLARRIRTLVQRSLLARGFLRLGLGCCLLPGLFGQLGRLGGRFGLLAHANQFGFARLLVLEFLFLNLAQLALAAFLVLAGLQLLLADDRGTCNHAARRRGFRRGVRDNRRFSHRGDGFNDLFDYRFDYRFDHRLDDGLDHRRQRREARLAPRQLPQLLRGDGHQFPA